MLPWPCCQANNFALLVLFPVISLKNAYSFDVSALPSSGIENDDEMIDTKMCMSMREGIISQ